MLNGLIKFKKRNLLIMAFIIFAVCALSVLFGCDGGYSGNHTAPDAKRNEVLYIERNKLGFARGMSVNSAEIIEKCNCTVINSEGETVPVTAELLNTPDFEYDEFELDSLGSNKKITLRYADAENYIFYDVNEYTVNFYTRPGKLWKSVDASAVLTDNLALSVWVDISNNNYSTDDSARTYDVNGAKLFNGWRDFEGQPVTGLHTLRAPAFGNERVLNLYADYISEEQYETMDIYYDDAGARVFGGYKGADTEKVVIPEGVTYVDFSSVFKGGFNFESLHIPSTATLKTPFNFAVNTVGLKSLSVDAGSTEYADFNGALYSKDYHTLYMMPASIQNVSLHGALNELGSYSCAYLQQRELELPDSVNILRHYCFSYSALKNLKGVENVKTIMVGAFFKSDLENRSDGIARYFARPDGKYVLDSVIDASITEYTVLPGTVSISGNAFTGCNALQSVTFNEGLESIGDSAFSGCVSLKEVTFPSSLKYMGGSVFYGCGSIERVTNLPDVTYRDKEGEEYEHTVPYELFYGCGALTSIRIADGTHTIGPRAFYNCESLADVVFNDGLAYIGTMSFRGSGVKQVDLPSGLLGFGTGAFSHSKLESIDFGQCPKLVSFPAQCFEYCQLKKVVLPDRIKVVPRYCFYYNRSLTEVALGKVTLIGERAFSQCNVLTSFDFGDSLEKIEERAFSQCVKLNNVVLPDSMKDVGGFVFQGCNALTHLTLGKGVQSFGEYTYLIDGVTFDVSKPPLWQCRNVQNIAVSAENTHFKSIDGVLYGNAVCGVDYGEASVLYAVPSDYPQKELALPDSVRVILPYAVEYQKKLSTVKLNDGLENIGKGAFYASGSITSLTVPSTVKHIGAGILLSCNNIDSFTISEQNPTYASDGNLVYSDNTLVMYMGLSKDVVVREGITNIAAGVFMNNAVIESIVIPDSVKSIGYRAFYGCTKLKSITVGSGLTFLDASAFSSLPNLEKITVAADNGSFMTKDNILYSKDGKKLLLAAAKNGMIDLFSISGVTEIGDWAFAYNATLTLAVIPEGVRSIGDYAFYECRKIEKFYGSQMLETIGERAFSFATSVNPDDVAETRYCDTLKTVVLYASTKSAGDYAFYGQYGIETLYLHMSLTQAEDFIAASGRNIKQLTHGNPIGSTGRYYNPVQRYLYSKQQPTISNDGYGWFYIDEQTGEPADWGMLAKG